MALQYGPGGVLFPNDQKKSDKAPDFSGSVELDETTLAELQSQLAANPHAKFDIAGWRKQSNGREFISLKISPPYKRDGIAQNPGGSSQGSQGSRPPPVDLDGDNIPF